MNINGHCPHCNADLDGELVIDYPLKQGKSMDKAIEYAKHYAGWGEHGVANRWGRRIGISSMKYDRVMEWQCPDCDKRWDR
jgi:hypothetical protein